MDALFTSKDEDNVVLNTKVIECDDQFSMASAAAAPDHKVRYICVTAGKKKVKIHKVKQDKPADNGVCVNLNGRAYYWILDSPHDKIELMHTLVSLYQKYLNKVPRLIGIDEEFLKAAIVKSDPKSNQSNAATAQGGGMAGSNTANAAPNKEQSAPTQMYNNDLDAFLEKEFDALQRNETTDFQTGFNMDELLGGFNWQVNGDAADLERKLESELQAWRREDQAEQVLYQIDSTLNELKTIDEWLLHYTTLLDRMGQDVHSVEVKNKVLQVTSFNQKALLQEIDKIVASMRLAEPVSERLKYESLDEVAGIKNCERVLKILMDTIARVKYDEEIADIAMVKERLGLYQSYATTFSVRLTEFITKLLTTSIETLTKENSSKAKQTLKIVGLDMIQMKLCHYRALMKWLKSVDTRKQYDLEMAYSFDFGKFYKKEIREHLDGLKSTFCKRKPNVDEQDYIFIIPQVSVSSAATNAISAMSSNIVEKGKGGWNMLGGNRKKSTMATEDDVDEGHKGSPILGRAATLKSKADRTADDDKIWPDEAMTAFYKSFCPIIVCEMNFVMDFFNLRKDDVDLDFSYEWLENLNNPRDKLKELKAQNKLNELYDAMFDVHDDICAFLDWTLKHDQTFTIGMMVCIEEMINRYVNSAYVNLVLQMELLMTKIVLNFDRFVDEQIKAIEETKVTFRKRNGILPFIRTFPKFVDHMEKCADTNQGQARAAVSNAYSRIVKCIFDTLEALAKDQNDGKESKVDDKESLNVHILTIENMHHFHSEIRARKIVGLEQHVKASKTLYDTNVEAYIKIVIRKPLGKLLEFFENVENLLKSNAPEEVSFHLHKVTLRDVLKKYPGKEIKKGLEQLYKRVEKSFTDEDGSLLQVVWRGIQEAFAKSLKRYEELIALCYPDTGLRVEFTMDDLLGYFSELAQKNN
ncbi:hypothetical protein BCR33DRAFT_784670 [Rhizoclosmatium globosum]|uniref:Uncharacterized protein n=1 Tax=Rhizoclosmatium globosum TaxID=329046 RepID=A0A1Y2CE07_9FUNG|nr:hypothetical protein BCR33DRAFT_784670 [Rhizoclosmatium globosum]|eukprot:ORY45273.1 hypothetical protein BCR33DRAFT_784670 [Rhizoclosmatium globosum]